MCGCKQTRWTRCSQSSRCKCLRAISCSRVCAWEWDALHSGLHRIFKVRSVVGVQSSGVCPHPPSAQSRSRRRRAVYLWPAFTIMQLAWCNKPMMSAFAPLHGTVKGVFRMRGTSKRYARWLRTKVHTIEVKARPTVWRRRWESLAWFPPAAGSQYGLMRKCKCCSNISHSHRRMNLLLHTSLSRPQPALKRIFDFPPSCVFYC